MYLVDSSAWIDYINDRPTRATDEVDRLLHEQPDDVVTTEPVIMELLAGPTHPTQVAALERLANGLPTLRLDPAVDFRAAAAISRDARRAGTPIRSLVDCLIAAVAVRHGVTLVHKDVDFERIADVTPLRQVSLR